MTGQTAVAITPVVWTLVALAALAAAVDWWGVARGEGRLIYVAKPAVMVLLMAAVALMPGLPGPLRACVLIGQAAGLVGDVAMMLQKTTPGSAAFLVGHLAYLAAWLQYWRSWVWAVIGALACAVLLLTLGRRIAAGAGARNRLLGRIVVVYLFAICAMAVGAFGTAALAIAASSVLFLASDTLLGWSRFVVNRPSARIWVHVLYHVAQVGFVLGLPMLLAG
ncbi:MAG: hypothetical protein RLZ55_1321 [Actinomycetota bacterium]|jgi:uncharacterized membrane protein YhhN